MELDTGAAVSIMSEKQCKQLWPGRSWGATTIRLQTYAKQPLAVLGSLDVQVVYEQQKVTLNVNVAYKRGVSGTKKMASQQFFNLHQVLTEECYTLALYST